MSNTNHDRNKIPDAWLEGPCRAAFLSYPMTDGLLEQEAHLVATERAIRAWKSGCAERAGIGLGPLPEGTREVRLPLGDYEWVTLRWREKAPGWVDWWWMSQLTGGAADGDIENECYGFVKGGSCFQLYTECFHFDDEEGAQRTGEVFVKIMRAAQSIAVMGAL